MASADFDYKHVGKSLIIKKILIFSFTEEETNVIVLVILGLKVLQRNLINAG